MQFQRINKPNPDIQKMFVEFCLMSKPYDFCHMPSRILSLNKIKEYMMFLFDTCEIYLGTLDRQIKLFVAVCKNNQNVAIEFIFGTPFGFMKNLKQFRKFYSNVNKEIRTFSAQIKRKHKLKSFLKFIEAKDSEMKIFLDKQEIAVLWNT